MMKMSGQWTILAIVAAGTIGVAAGCGGDGGGSGGSGTSTTGSGGQIHGTGGGASCVDASTYADLFTIVDTSFCAVALYTADEPLGFQAPTWGAHGGPLWSVPDAAGGGVTIERWTAPSGATGALGKQVTHVDAMIPAGAFAGAQALDLPFFGWTAISWSGAFPDTQGKLLALSGAKVDRGYDVNGAYAIGAVGDATSGRLLYTGLSPLGDAAVAVSGFYAADACDTPMPDLGAGQGCEASKEIAAWGDSSGPVALDLDGNAFVVLPSFATGDQEARGFAKAEIARGAKATPGASLFTLPGFGSALAAIAPRSGNPGLLVFQPFDATATPLDVVAQRYTASGAITADGAPTKLLAVSSSSPASLSIITDDAGRLWVAASHDATTTFVVLDRAP